MPKVPAVNKDSIRAYRKFRRDSLARVNDSLARIERDRQDSLNKVIAKNGVLANDVNPDGKSTLKAYLAVGSSLGTVKLEEDGSFTYEAGEEEGEDMFSYYVVNAEGDTSEMATVALTILYKNKAPTPVAGVADTIKRLTTLTEDFGGAVTFLKKEMLDSNERKAV